MASATRSAAAAALLLLASTYVLTLGQESATTGSTTVDVTSTTTVKGTLVASPCLSRHACLLVGRTHTQQPPPPHTHTGPRTNVELTTSTSTADTTGDDALRGGPVSSAVGAAATRVTGAISGAIDAAHAAIGERLRAVRGHAAYKASSVAALCSDQGLYARQTLPAGVHRLVSPPRSLPPGVTRCWHPPRA